MVKIKGKIFKVGNSYGVRIKKALIESEIFKEGQEIVLLVQDVYTILDKKIKNSLKGVAI